MTLIQHLLSFLAFVGTVQAGFLITHTPCKQWFHWDLTLNLKPFTKKPPPPSPLPPAAGCQRRVCYFTNYWSGGRRYPLGFPPEDFDASLCTHIICSHAWIWENKGSDIMDKPQYWALAINRTADHQISALKKNNPDLKVLVSFPASSKLIKGVIQDKGQSIFSLLTIQELVEQGFDGIDWYLPASSESLDQDKINIIRLMKELRVKFKKRAKDCQSDQPLLMTATLPAYKATAHSGYDIPALSRELDFINLMSALLGEPDRGHNINAYANIWIKKGFPKEKIVIGIPAYGSSYSPTHATHDYVTYNEVCHMINHGALVKRTRRENVPTILKHDSSLVSYEDLYSIMTKIKYVKDKGYGGVMVRSLDDFNTTACRPRKYPLLNCLKQECSN